MRLIHTADWHLGKHIEGHSRLEEQELFLEDFVNIVKERDADIIRLLIHKERSLLKSSAAD